MATAITHVLTWLRGMLVGVDNLGNKYYQDRRISYYGRRRRWVVYHGDDEASSVPPEWHAWLHYTVNNIPKEREQLKMVWQRNHLPNLTGTEDAYRPPGHTLEGGKRSGATGDYEPWKPD